MRLAKVRLARADLAIYRPGTDRLLTDGRTVDLEHPYWAGHLADGSILEMTDAPDPALDSAAEPTTAAPVPDAAPVRRTTKG